ncbi:MAG: hypothetical protein J5I94_25240, partial [Phaeodactylibacter sp.]|nr:hypothetical protein [Phaeodactylibacter sp.]
AILSRKWDRLVSRLKSRKSEFGPEWALNAFFSAFRLPISAFDAGTSKVQMVLRPIDFIIWG